MNPWVLLTRFGVNNPFPNVTADGNTVTTVINVVFGIAGAIALLIITVGGFKYVISRGDPQATNQAKDTILYAVVGLVITIMAAAIVNFVIKNIFG